MKIVKSLEESGLLIEGISETIKNEVREQKGVFLPLLWAVSLLGSALAGKGVIPAFEQMKQSLGQVKNFNALIFNAINWWVSSMKKFVVLNYIEHLV